LSFDFTHVILDATQIARLIPHQGSMCLIDRVCQSDERSIACLAVSHRDPFNPLRENGMLHAICGVEYAAQAMAIHGATLSRQGNRPPRGGRLAGIRTLDLQVLRLDDIKNDLEICATQILGDDNSMVYEFFIGFGKQRLLEGRATVILMPT
jgi:predicted hotdog family 3-hydroxylacyl-ACP dehydratase